MYHVERQMFVIPALVGIHGYRQLRHRADGFYQLLVVVTAQLHLQDIELTGTFLRLLPHYLWRINAYGEGCREGALLLSSPHILYHGACSSLPTRSCKAMSTAALAAALPSDKPSI